MSHPEPQEEALPGLAMPQCTRPAVQATNGGRRRFKPVDRLQTVFRTLDVEQLIGPEHPARAIWELVGQLDLSGFEEPIQSVEGGAGRPAWNPHLLASLWVYGYSLGISSARELGRRCAYDPAFQWLTGLEEVNYHTLADFRSTHDAALPKLFVQLLGVLSSEGLVTLERVMQDGTKVKALAAKSRFQKEDKLREHLAAAQAQVEALKDWQGDESARHKAARQRAAQERQSRVKQALAELEQLRQDRSGEVRVSHTEPEARNMKQADGGFAPSYNVQVSTDAANKVILAGAVTQEGNDWGQLIPAVERVEQNCGAKPKQVVADTGYTTRENVSALAAQGVEFYGSFREPGVEWVATEAIGGFNACAFTYEPEQDVYRCPVGTVLRHIGRKRKQEALEHRYRADSRACSACPFQEQCCGHLEAERPRERVRIEESAVVVSFRRRMEQPEARAIYRQRSEVAEFPNAWLKAKLGLRQFRLRGLVKVGLEVLWACLTYNIQQWIRLRWMPKLAVSRG